MVIAIDGPAGAGKSTVAKAVAAQLGFTYLDTGAMYRAVALATRRRHRPPGEVAREIRIEVGDRVTIDGEDVTDAIRTPQVSEDASRVASDPEVRAALVEQQQRLLHHGDWVAEGRDIALVVAPDADGQGVPHGNAGGAGAAARQAARRQRRHGAQGADPARRARQHRRAARRSSPRRTPCPSTPPA